MLRPGAAEHLLQPVPNGIRYTGAGPGPNGEQPGRLLAFSLVSAPLNFAARTRRGIDFNVNYRTNLSENVRLSTNLIYTHNLEISNFEDPTNPDFENRILGEIGDPVDEFRWDVDLSYREFTFGYRMRYIGPMYVGAYENYEALPTGCTGTTVLACPPFNTDATEPAKYPEIFYHDLRFEWTIRNTGGIADSLQFYFGVDNVLDTAPPLGTTATAGGTVDLRRARPQLLRRLPRPLLGDGNAKIRAGDLFPGPFFVPRSRRRPTARHPARTRTLTSACRGGGSGKEKSAAWAHGPVVKAGRAAMRSRGRGNR